MNRIPTWLAVVAVIAVLLAAIEYSPKVGGLLLILLVFALLATGLRRGTIGSTV